jgi:hypothetical protein
MALPVFSNITRSQGIDNIGGTSEKWLFSPLAWITELKDVTELDDPAATTFDEYAEIADDHVFAAGKAPFAIYCTMDKGKGSFDPQGERDSRSAKGTFSMMTPGIDPKLVGMMRSAKNYSWIVWPILADGKIIQLGSPRFSCDVVCKFDIATNSSGYRGAEITVTCMESGGPYRYSGAFPT